VCGLLPNKNGVKNNKLYDVCHGIDLTFSSQNCYVLINLFVESDLGDLENGIESNEFWYLSIFYVVNFNDT